MNNFRTHNPGPFGPIEIPVREKLDYEFLYRLEPYNKTYDPEEGVQAKIKDPLWMLGRQWQLEEFTATNGGNAVWVEAEYMTQTLNELSSTTHSEAIDVNAPIEFFIEKEDHAASAFWNPKRLEYNCYLGNELVSLSNDEYSGDNIDWYSFNLIKDNWNNLPHQKANIKPRTIKYHGMPSARWWSFEEGNVNLNALNRPYCNILTMALVEFGLIYSQDWYLFSLPISVGDIRKIHNIIVVDSFGIAEDINPVADNTPYDNGFEVFTLSPENETHLSDGSLFYFPNNLQLALESYPMEEVNFFRDELSNLVWAVEHAYTDDRNVFHNRHDEESIKTSSALKPLHYWDGTQLTDTLQESGKETLAPLYLEESLPPSHWIPYIQKRFQNQAMLRRGKTYNGPEKQYKGKIISQSALVAEEEITNVGIKIIRSVQLARSTNGEVVKWEGRKKLADQKRMGNNLKFDQLINI